MAVHRLGKYFFLTMERLQHLHSAIHKFSSLTSLDMTCLYAMTNQQHLDNLSALTTLKDLSIWYTAANSAAGLRLAEQQTCLTRLHVTNAAVQDGVKDPFLLKVAGMQSLVHLQLNLREEATDAGISSISGLTSLKALTLPVSTYRACVSATSVSLFTALTRLTCLSLIGWPITDAEVLYITRLTGLRRIDLSDCERLSCLAFMPLLQFPRLDNLRKVRGDEWLIDPIVAMFELLRPSIKIQL